MGCEYYKLFMLWGWVVSPCFVQAGTAWLREVRERVVGRVMPQKGTAMVVEYLSILRYKNNKITNNCNKHMSHIHI